jgi:hypothetical protein
LFWAPPEKNGQGGRLVSGVAQSPGRAGRPLENYHLRHAGRLVRRGGPPISQGPFRVRIQGEKGRLNLGAPGNSAVRGELRALPEVRGIALGTFGELSESANLLIEGLAHEGAL